MRQREKRERNTEREKTGREELVDRGSERTQTQKERRNREITERPD